MPKGWRPRCLLYIPQLFLTSLPSLDYRTINTRTLFFTSQTPAELHALSCYGLKAASLGGNARHAQLGFHNLFAMINVYGIAKGDIKMISLLSRFSKILVEEMYAQPNPFQNYSSLP
jgi:hypothetical protein